MIQFLIILFGLTMLYVGSMSRVEAYIKALAVQGIILFLIVIIDYGTENLPNMLFLSAETLIVKAILIPIVLIKVVRKNGIHRELEPYIPNFFSLLITSIIFALGFYIAYWMTDNSGAVRPFYFGVSISTLVTGFFVIMTRKKIITHVMGYMLIENGIFLLALSIAREMPFIVALGVLLDIFIAVYLLGLFVNKIQDVFAEIQIDNLSTLKD